MLRALLMVVVIIVAAVLVYSFVYPGLETRVIEIGVTAVGPAAGPQFVGLAVLFNTGRANLLHVYFRTSSATVFYVLTGAEFREYLFNLNSSVYPSLWSKLNGTPGPFYLSLSSRELPFDFVYHSSYSESHSLYLPVKMYELYGFIVLSQPNSTVLGLQAGKIGLYSSLIPPP